MRTPPRSKTTARIEGSSAAVIVSSCRAGAGDASPTAASTAFGVPLDDGQLAAAFEEGLPDVGDVGDTLGAQLGHELVGREQLASEILGQCPAVLDQHQRLRVD